MSIPCWRHYRMELGVDLQNLCRQRHGLCVQYEISSTPDNLQCEIEVTQASTTQTTSFMRCIIHFFQGFHLSGKCAIFLRLFLFEGLLGMVPFRLWNALDPVHFLGLRTRIDQPFRVLGLGRSRTGTRA